MSLHIRAITLDLDDTLWPFAPIGARIDQVLYDWMRKHSPVTAERFPVEAMRALGERNFADNPHLHHDLSALRRLTLEMALRQSGGDLALLEPACDVFHAVRNQVECYPDVLDALARIAAHVPVAALSNGNADLQRIGLMQHFAFQLSSGEHGSAKPDPSIFLAACARLGVPAANVLHVGDHVSIDVLGALDAGLHACWINRHGVVWSHPAQQPDLEFDSMTGLADWLDAQPLHAGSTHADISMRT